MPRFLDPRRFMKACAAALLIMLAYPMDATAYTAPEQCDTVGPMANDPIIEKEIFHVAGDAVDPTQLTQARGLQSGYSMTQAAAGHPKCLYRFGTVEMLVEADVYRLEGQPMYLHLLCPHCLAREHNERNAIRVMADRKEMSYDPKALVPAFPGWTDEQMRYTFPGGAGGLLNVSQAFQCTWEVDPRLRARAGNICDFKVVIENNVVRAVTHAAAGVIYGGAIR